MGRQIEFTIVVPMYNEAAGILAFWQTLAGVLDTLPHDFEVLLVDDGSQDGTVRLIEDLAVADPRVRGIALSRNFGHQTAITAGIEHARGQAVITMDADLQHPPDVLPELIRVYQLGYDVVFTRRIDNTKVSLLKRWTSSAFYWLMSRMSDVPIEPNAADFRLMGPKAVAAFLQCGERSRFARGLVSWIGFRQTSVSFEVSDRVAGRSKYTLRKMFLLAFDGLTSFSSHPLRVSWLFGMLLTGGAMVYFGYAMLAHYRGDTVPGWTSIVLITMILGGVQLFSIGILGEYIGRIFTEVKQRPLYFIQSDTNEAASAERVASSADTMNTIGAAEDTVEAAITLPDDGSVPRGTMASERKRKFPR